MHRKKRKNKKLRNPPYWTLTQSKTTNKTLAVVEIHAHRQREQKSGSETNTTDPH